MSVAGYIDIGKKVWSRVYRRFWSDSPTSKTGETDVAWQERQFKYYATQQPYTSPLTLANGNLTGETWEMRMAYREWSLREPSAKSALLTKCLAVCQLDPQLKASDKNNEQSREAAKWVDWAVSRSTEGWPGVIFNMLFPALTDGFSVNEKVFDKVPARESRYAGWWTLESFAGIDTQHTRFKLDLYRQVIGVQSTMGTQGAYMLAPTDFVIFTHLKIFENPFGVSDLRAAVRACRLIESAIRLRHILLTNYSGPFLKAQAGDNAARQALMGVLENARANGWIIVPEGAELEVLSLSVANLETFRTAIEDYRQEIVTAIQGAYLQLLEGGVSNARGDTEVHKGIAELFQWWLAAWVCQVINKQLIPDLVIPNFGHAVGFPRLTLGGIDESAISKALDRFKKGHELGLTLSAEQVMDVGGFEVAKGDDDALPPPNQQGQQPGGGNDPFGGGMGDSSGQGGQDPNADQSFAHVGEGGLVGSADSFRGHDFTAASELLGIDPVRLPGTARRVGRVGVRR